MSNTASHADLWLAPWPGQRGRDPAVGRLLPAAHAADRRRLPASAGSTGTSTWSNVHPDAPRDFATFLDLLTEDYARYTFEFAAAEAQIPVERIEELARARRRVRRAGSRRTSGARRRPATYGGWQVSRALWFVLALTGSIGTKGGTSPNGWDKFIPHGPNMPPAVDWWNELTWPAEYPMSTNEMSILLPHFLKDGRGKLDVYFTRVYNPIWTNPDGFTWMEALTDESMVGLHVALTPTWSETAEFADYVLPMGHSLERHDTHSYETHAGKWLGFRQPVRRVAMEKLGRPVADTRESNPGEVWEENEYWFELSWRIDPDGSLGIRKYFESPYRPGEKVTVDEYYRWIFENQVPGLPEKAAALGHVAAALHAQVRRRGGGLATSTASTSGRSPTPNWTAPSRTTDGVLRKPVTLDSAPPLVGEAGVGRRASTTTARARSAGSTPSRKLEVYSTAMRDWGWPEHATPTYIESHVSRRQIDPDARRVRAGADVPAAHADPHPLGERQVPQRDQQHPPALDEREGRRPRTGSAPVTWSGSRPGSATSSSRCGRPRASGPASWRCRTTWAAGGSATARAAAGSPAWSTSTTPTASGRCGRSRACARSTPTTRTARGSTGTTPACTRTSTFPVQPDPWSGAHCWLQKVTAGARPPGGPVRRRRRRHDQVARGLPRVAGQDPAHARAGRAAPAGVPDAAGQADAAGVPAMRFRRDPSIDLELVRDAVGRVEDPEIHRPIADLGMLGEVVVVRRPGARSRSG